MSYAFQLQENDEGTRITLVVRDDDLAIVDISGATTLTFKFHNPSGTLTEKTGTLSDDGTDGKMYYDTDAAFITPDGNWKLQGYVVTPGGKWHTEIFDFLVNSNLE